MRTPLAVLALALMAPTVAAQWDATKPVAGPASPVEIRRNWIALQDTMGVSNLLLGNTFPIWTNGSSSAPDYFALAGTGAAVARTGTAEADTSRKFGTYAAKVTSGSATATLTQTIPYASPYDDGYDGLTVACGAYLKASTTSTARLKINDGSTSTYSSYHTGSGTWQWLTAVHTIDASATTASVALEVAASSKVGYLSAPTCLLGSVPPAHPHLSRSVFDSSDGGMAVGYAGTTGTSIIYARRDTNAAAGVTVLNLVDGTAVHSDFQLLAGAGSTINGAIRAHDEARTATQGGYSLSGAVDFICVTCTTMGMFTLGSAPIKFGTTNGLRLTIEANGHLTSGRALSPVTSDDPSLSSCGTTPTYGVGDDKAGRFTVGSGTATTCTLTFNQAWATAPACFIMNETTAVAMKCAPTTTTCVITAAGGANFASASLSYWCMGIQ